MAAPCYGPWNSRDLIPPPTNFLKINLARLSDEESHSHDDLKSTLYSIQNGRDLNGSLLKGELVTLSRFLYKNKNSQRNWKLYGLLVKLKKCLERLANTSIHSYTGTMLSAWDGFPDLSTPVISLPSRQMLEYLCVGLQGCTKLCAYIASQCEQAALLMIETLHNGMFLSSSLVFLAIVSRIRVLICNFFKSAVGWYDNLVTVRSFLPSTNSEWLPKGTELPGTLLEWLGDEASRLTLDVTSSKNASELSLLDRLFNTSLEVSLDMTEGGEREVTAISQLLMSTGLEVKRNIKDGEEQAVTVVSQQPTGTGLEIRMDNRDVGEQDVTKVGQQPTGFGLEVKMDMKDIGEHEVTKVGQQPTGTGLEIRMDMRGGGGREVTAVAQQPTDNNLMVRMDTKAKGEREVTVSCQQSKSMPATLPDLGGKLESICKTLFHYWYSGFSI
nr:nucleolus and neural progenitor protein-like [Lytechinus pictus]